MDIIEDIEGGPITTGSGFASGVEQDVSSGYARHDLGQDPEPYTFEDMTTPRVIDEVTGEVSGGFAIVHTNTNGLEEPIIAIRDAKDGKWLDDIFVLDIEKMIATSDTTGEAHTVDYDGEGLWFSLGRVPTTEA